MALIGKDIDLIRSYVDPNAEKPNLNYKYTLPITVLEAIKLDSDHIDKDDPSLADVIDELKHEMFQKQTLIPGKSPNYIMTYAGTPGAVGSIKISQQIPWDPTKQSHDKIPTEKAVGDLLYKLGLMDEDGNIVESANRVRWSDILGRPLMYDNLGSNEDGFITQKGITDAISKLQSSVEGLNDEWVQKINASIKVIDEHVKNQDNPHIVSLDQIGAASAEAFKEHTDATNPHGVTKEQIGLGNADDTSDLDKPISNATQAALDALQALIDGLTNDTDEMNYVTNAEYDKESGRLIISFRNGSNITIMIPTNGLIDEIGYDTNTKDLLVYELSGTIKKVSLLDLYIRYLGSESTNITIRINGNQVTGDQIIEAIINERSITDREMADDSVITRVIKDSAVTTVKIKDSAVITDKIANEAVTTEKIAPKNITNTRINDRSVDGRTLFSSDVDNRILGVKKAKSNPSWMQIISEMIADEEVKTINIQKFAITTDKLADESVTKEKLAVGSVTTEKIKDGSVTNDKIANDTITGDKLTDDIAIPGTPTISKRPDKEDDSNKVPDTRWVTQRIHSSVFKNSNLDDRIINGRVLFSSDVANRALVINKAKSDPVWGLINSEMMDNDSVLTKNIKDLAVTEPKIADESIITRHIGKEVILDTHIAESAVTLDKIATSGRADMVLAAVKELSHPVYTKIKHAMMDIDSVSGKNIQNLSVPPMKMETDITGYKVLGVMMGNSTPQWVRIVNEMLTNESVDGRVLFSSPMNDAVLGVATAGDDPAWTKIYREMLNERIITRLYIGKNEIYQEHLQDRIIDSQHIVPNAIDTEHLSPRSVTADILFTSKEPDRVLAVIGDPYSNPVWTKISGEMLEDESIRAEKLFRSDVPNRVLGVTRAGRVPEYILIDSRFIVDNSINPAKLQPNFVLNGTPLLTSEPLPEADNFQLANTAWIRKTITSMATQFTEGLLLNSIHGKSLINNTVTGDKLFTNTRENQVIGITEPNGVPKYLKIINDMIADGTIASNKLQRDIMLLGEPRLEIRPAYDSCDENLNGDLIPDCQWVINKIKEAGGFGGTETKPEDEITQYSYDDLINIWDGFPLPEDYVEYLSGRGMGQITPAEVQRLWDDGTLPIESGHDPVNFSCISETEVYDLWYSGIGPDEDNDDSYNVPSASLLPGSVTTVKIQNRAVTGPKLFTSPTPNRVLAVEEANTDPKYVQVNNEMIQDRSVDGYKIFSSDIADRVLAVHEAGQNAEWVQINHYMLGDNSVGNNNIMDNAISGKKLQNKSVTREKMTDEPFVDEALLLDNSVTRRKILDGAVDNYKLANLSIDSKKLRRNLVLKGDTVVDDSKDYETRKLRNTILSPKIPSGGSNGDIWFRFT